MQEPEKSITFATATDKSRFVKVGAIAKLLEQRTENPCVPGSIPGGTTLQLAECIAVGSALRSGRRGRAFESPHSDIRTNKPLYLSGLFVFKKKNRN